MREPVPTNTENVDNKKSELNSLKTEIANADLTSNKKSDLTQKVDEFFNKLEKTADIANLSGSMNKLINTIKSEILGNKLEKIKYKNLNILTFDEAKLFAYSIVGTWPWTELLIKLSQDKPYMITRIIALALHEWYLMFGRKNPWPVSKDGKIVMDWEDRTSRQLHTKSPEATKKKFEESLAKWKEFCEEKWVKVWNWKLNYKQADLISWLWYNLVRTNGKENLNKLALELNESDLKVLIYDDIQWWVEAIWDKVVENLEKPVSFYLDKIKSNNSTNYPKYKSEFVEDAPTNDNSNDSNPNVSWPNNTPKVEEKTWLRDKVKTFFSDIKQKLSSWQWLFNWKIKTFFSNLFKK